MAQSEALYGLFDQQVAHSIDACTHLNRYLTPGYNALAIASHIADIEGTGDALFAQIQHRLALSSIVPVLRRHEAAMIAESFEAILNLIRDAAFTLRLLDGAAPDRQTDILITYLTGSVEKLQVMVTPMRTFQHGPILEARRKMTLYEKEAEHAAQIGTSLLFHTDTATAKDLLRSVMIFDVLLRAIRRCHRASECVEHVVLRHGDFRATRFAPDT
jgi:uncharacterized protein Yka (UPF0111/DUF47 family)